MRRPRSPLDKPLIRPVRVGLREGTDGISVIINPHLINAGFIDSREGRLKVKHYVRLA